MTERDLKVEEIRWAHEYKISETKPERSFMSIVGKVPLGFSIVKGMRLIEALVSTPPKEAKPHIEQHIDLENRTWQPTTATISSSASLRHETRIDKTMSFQGSETTSKDPCVDKLRSANICVQTDTQACVSCFDSTTFQTALAQETSLEFSKAMASAMPTDPNFCDVANQKVCDYYISNQSCCCQEEIAVYRQCL